MNAQEPLLHLPAASPTEEIGVANWRGLSAMPKKRELYSKETYFRESWRDARQCLGSLAVPQLQRTALLVLKPDAFFGRRAEAAIDFFRERRFVPIAWTEFRYTRCTMREDWRYQLNQLSTDRLELNERLLTCADSTLVLFHDGDREPALPAAVRMQALKGNSLPELHQPHQLRSVLHSTNRLFKFVHTADEPADIVRELGVLFDSALRLELYRMMGAGQSDGSEALQSHLHAKYAQFPEHALGLQQSLALLKQASAAGGPRARRLAVALERYATDGLPPGRFLCLDAFEAELDAAGLALPFLDTLVLATHFIHHSYPLEFAVMRGDGHDGWLSGEGRMAAPGEPCLLEQESRP